jgi:hypothetical protein
VCLEVSLWVGEYDKREFDSTASLKLLLQYLFGTYRNVHNTTPRDPTVIKIKLAPWPHVSRAEGLGGQ